MNQFIAQEIAESRSLGRNSNAAYRDHQRRQRLQRDAIEIARDIAKDQHGPTPIQWADGRLAGFELTPIEDYPRNWTADRIAAHREHGRAILREIESSPHLARLVSHYLGGPRLTGGSRYRARQAAGIVD